MEFGYGPDDGPTHWILACPNAGGRHQSPIDIETDLVKFDHHLHQHHLKIDIEKEHNPEVMNNGHSFEVEIREHSTLTGGILGHEEYHLRQFHFHWGLTDHTGSEHTVNGKHYAAELHFVTYDPKKYGTFNEALAKKDGLAVLAVFIKVGKHENKEFEKLCDLMHSVEKAHTSCHMKGVFHPSKLLPSDTTKYYTYPGSLTTPPLSECVRWIIMEEPIHVSEHQLKCLRHLKDAHGGPLEDNFRPTMPLGDRVVKASFK
ncbi:carbonic anhydrase 2-like [Haliotis rubra]|uniref:carbonic anhydrase 2-like n=1 Tax=Haliotis rubra TaxID=36100 RepID=UPI001EE5FC13|nr:carbonic anhydrase 2-like [Haliotis rubra]